MPTRFNAFGSAPATSPRPPVFEYGTASADRTATRISQQCEMQNAQWKSTVPLCIVRYELRNLLRLHRRKEFGVRLGLAETLEDDFHLFDGRQRIENSTHYPDAVEVVLADEQLFLANT